MQTLMKFHHLHGTRGRRPAPIRDAIEAALKANPRRSNVQLARDLGRADISIRVGSIRRRLEERGEIDVVITALSADGRIRPIRKLSNPTGNPAIYVNGRREFNPNYDVEVFAPVAALAAMTLTEYGRRNLHRIGELARMGMRRRERLVIAAFALINALGTAAGYSCAHPLSGDLRAFFKLLQHVQRLHADMEREWLSYPKETRQHVEELAKVDHNAQRANQRP